MDSVGDQNKYIDLDLKDPYEDDDFKIYFDKKSIQAHIAALE